MCKLRPWLADSARALSPLLQLANGCLLLACTHRVVAAGMLGLLKNLEFVVSEPPSCSWPACFATTTRTFKFLHLHVM